MTQLQLLRQSPPHSSSLGNNVEQLVGVADCGSPCDLSLEEKERVNLVTTLIRKSLAACNTSHWRQLCAMEIGWPSDVRHVAHVTFDRFNGFLGLPVEFEPDVPRRVPSASATVFGVSTESMQLSYDTRGNSVPTILLLMQHRLYAQGGLQAEGIFRISAENSQEEYVRDQLNGGVVPDGVGVHCLAGLIKAWFRELPTGILDSLQTEQVIQSQTEEDCAELVRNLPPTESALLDWAINLMADVVEHENVNKMNARNVATVFAPNMTQMDDPLTALMYAVQVMNFLKTLINRTLRQRQDSILDSTPDSRLKPFDGNGDQSPSQSCSHNNERTQSFSEDEQPVVERSCNSSTRDGITTPDEDDCSSTTPLQKPSEIVNQADDPKSNQVTDSRMQAGQPSNSKPRKIPGRQELVLHLTPPQQSILRLASPVEKTRAISNLSRLNSRAERVEAWR
ncbi:Rho GTPase-activating protein 1 [Linum grandiflorum]